MAQNNQTTSKQFIIALIWSLNIFLLIILLLIIYIVNHYSHLSTNSSVLSQNNIAFLPETQPTLSLSLLSQTISPTLITPSTFETPTPLPPITQSPTTDKYTQIIIPTQTITAIIIPTIQPQMPNNSIIIGSSVENRPLEIQSFGQGEIKRLIIAGIHGGYEWNTTSLADELIEHINANPEIIPEDKTLYILRCLNPDGLHRSTGYDGRANSNGVDLNRNWDSLWQKEWPLAGCWAHQPITAGDYPMSEPETIALASFLLEYDIEALINYHSAALGIFPGGQPPDHLSEHLAQSLASVSPYSYPPIDTGCIYTGQLIDWASNNGIAAVDIELTNHKDTDFDINIEILKTFLNW